MLTQKPRQARQNATAVTIETKVKVELREALLALSANAVVQPTLALDNCHIVAASCRPVSRALSDIQTMLRYKMATMQLGVGDRLSGIQKEAVRSWLRNHAELVSLLDDVRSLHADLTSPNVNVRRNARANLNALLPPSLADRVLTADWTRLYEAASAASSAGSGRPNTMGPSGSPTQASSSSAINIRSDHLHRGVSIWSEAPRKPRNPYPYSKKRLSTKRPT